MERVIEQTETALSRLREAKHLIDAVSGTGEAADGMIRATADGGGSLTAIDINPRALRLDVTALGRQVTGAIRLAQRDASRRTSEILQDADSATATVQEPLDETFVRERIENAARDIYRQS
ncbi:MAG: YbaB/EbfC family nucleoid-associated protein [Nonomuraea sp.]|nr:YbaB/EbfC family nucleoid-associated protein [Nonomuraea sp.]